MPFPPDAPKKISAKLEAGILPRTVEGPMFAGKGTGLTCDGCDTPITRAQVEWEYTTAEGRVIRFHLGCAGVWEAERRARGWL